MINERKTNQYITMFKDNILFAGQLIHAGIFLQQFKQGTPWTMRKEGNRLIIEIDTGGKASG